MVNAEDHNEVVKGLIEAAVVGTEGEGKVFDGKAPNLTDPPYWSLYPDPGVVGQEPRLLAGPSDHLNLVLMIHAVGTDRWQAGWAADIARDALVGVKPVVAGRSCWPIRQEYAQAAREDVDDPSLYLAVAGYRIRSD